MERVQIVGGANGVFYDSAGRMLRTMGDIHPRVGDWVWTNGMTIYGHREAGNPPETISNPIRSILPLLIHSYTSGNQEVRHINQKGELEKFVEFSYKDKPLYSYVGDEKNAYGSIYGKSYKPDWYNLLTGEFLGSFDPIDACIADNGDLLSIECEKGSTYNAGTIPGIDDYKLSACPLYEAVDGVEPPTKTLSVTGMYYEKKKGSGTEPFSQQGKIIIRRNGKMTKTIELDDYMDSLGNIVQLQASQIHGINGGCGEGRDFLLTADADNIQTGKRKRPVPQLTFKSASPYALKIYPDGSYLGYIEVSANASAFPVVESEINKSFVSRSDEETPRIKTKDFFRTSVNAYRIFGIGKTEGEYYFTNSVVGSGAFYGGEVAKLGSKAPITVTLFDPLPGYKLKAARYKGPYVGISENVGNYDTWTVISESDIVYSGLGRKIDRDRVVNALKNTGMGNVQAEKLVEVPVETTYDIHNGFSIRLEFNDPTQPESAKSLTLIGPDREEIVTLTSDSGYGMLIYYWYKLVACKLDKDVYFLALNQDYGPAFVIEKGVLKNVASTMRNYSLVPFRNRNILRRAIKKLCAGEGK